MVWESIQRIVALAGLILVSPILAVFLFLVWWQDKHSPFYIALRTGKDGAVFRMFKIRSMVINADKSGVDSTATDDRRITRVGQIVRKYKLDELMQLVNVVTGDMNLVGPRPNVPRETDLYTSVERELLTVRPGITDFSSIVFADEGEILKGSDDPDIDYHQLIRPGKSMLGIFYVQNRSFWVDARIVVLTVLAIICRSCALSRVSKMLAALGAPDYLVQLSSRENDLNRMPPPGATSLVVSRDGRVS